MRTAHKPPRPRDLSRRIEPELTDTAYADDFLRLAHVTLALEWASHAVDLASIPSLGTRIRFGRRLNRHPRYRSRMSALASARCLNSTSAALYCVIKTIGPLTVATPAASSLAFCALSRLLTFGQSALS